MRTAIRYSLIGILLPLALAGQGAEATSVTLFNTGRVIVRRTLPVSISVGTNTVTIPLGIFEPASLMVLDPGTHLGQLSFDGASSEEALLRRHIGEELSIERGADREIIRAKLLAVQPERWQVDEAVFFGRPGTIRWELSHVPATPVTDLTVTSDRVRRGLKLLYATSGASWGVNYSLVLGASGRVEGVAMITSGTLQLEGSEVQLLAGDIGTLAPTPSPRWVSNLVPRDQVAVRSAMAGMTMQEAVGEAQIYTLPGRITFTPSTQIVAPLFDPTPARAERRFTVAGSMPFLGGFGQMSDEVEVPVAVAYRLERELGTAFGDLPLPAGGVQVFDVDRAGRLQLIGMGGIGHTAPGEELNVSTGTAFDVTARRTQTAYTTQRSTAPNTNRTTAYASFRVDLQNAKDSAVVVEVREDRGGDWSIVESSLPAEKRSATRTVFTVTIPPKGKSTLTYRVRVVW